MVGRANVALIAAVTLVFAIPITANADDMEAMMWELVSTSGDLDRIEAFIESYPDSEHIENARAIADEIRQRDNAIAMEESIFEAVGAVSFSAPLAFGDEHIMGRTLAQIIQSSPAYPPIEGLPDDVWRDRPCVACHQWTREDLCIQANTYVSKDPKEYREKMHPFGGLLKMNLRNWAQNDCR